MKSRADIIKAQESIGNVEINKEKFDNLPDDCCKGWISITNKEDYEGYDSDIYFAPRSVVHPSCQKKKDNHSQQGEVAMHSVKPDGDSPTTADK